MVKKINGLGLIVFFIIYLFLGGYISAFSMLSDDIINLLSYCILTFYLILIFWLNNVKASFFFNQEKNQVFCKKFLSYIVPFIAVKILLSVSTVILIKLGIIYGEPSIGSFVRKVYFSENINYFTCLFVFMAPILEEFVFRGVLTNKLTQYFNIKISILISLLLFTIGHNSILVVFWGLFLNLVYVRSQSIFYPILFHFINNALVYIKIYFIQKYLDDSSVLKIVGNFDDVIMITLYTAWFASIIVIIIYIYKYFIKANFSFDERGRIVYKQPSETM